MKYVAGYSRTSTINQSSGLEAQIRAMDVYAKQNEITHFKHFSDSGISGSKASRPQLDLMMKEVEQGNVSAILCFSFSRFARSTRHLLDALEYFQKKDVEFISISENFSVNSPMGKAMFGVISIISELERELISERVKNGLKNAIAKGKKVGRPKTRPSQSILALHSEAYSYREISKLLGISHMAVSREVKNFKRNQKQQLEN